MREAAQFVSLPKAEITTPKTFLRDVYLSCLCTFAVRENPQPSELLSPEEMFS